MKKVYEITTSKYGKAYYLGNTKKQAKKKAILDDQQILGVSEYDKLDKPKKHKKYADWGAY